MGPSALTIIIPVVTGQCGPLKEFLRAHIEPGHGQSGARPVCKPLMPFDQLDGLHFASILVLDADGERPARLVFETTFDGDRDAFLADLVSTAPHGVHAIFSKCVGYPKTGIVLPSRLIAYLAGHDIGAHLMYRGTAGRTVSQIRREIALRRELQARSAEAAAQSASNHGCHPYSLGGLQTMLQTAVVRRDKAIAWAEDRYRDPPEVTFGSLLLFKKLLPILAVFVALWLCAYLLVLAPHGDWLTHSSAFTRPFDWSVDAGRRMVANCTPNSTGSQSVCGFFGALMGYPALPFPPLAFLLFGVVLSIRAMQHRRLRQYINPFEHTRNNSAAAAALAVTRYTLAALTFLLFASALVDVPAPTRNGCNAPENLLGRSFYWILRPQPAGCNPCQWPGGGFVAIVFAAVAALYVCLLFMRTTIRIRTQFLMDIGQYETLDNFKLDLLRFGLLFTGGILVVGGINWTSHLIGFSPFEYVSQRWLLYAGVVVILAAHCALFWLVLWHCLLEWVERRRQADGYQPPHELLLLPSQNQNAYDREDRGNNHRQNHLASLTYVKPGLWNYLSLRITLWAIDLLALYHYNKGTLGDIPTILSARWVLIDNGRQLLFLDHYAGAWDSYLSEFIDMGAVKGVNAIWTNTFVRARQGSDGATLNYSFPKTEYVFWKGAQDERAFKSYVRHSQVETLVWYGAYTDLDVVAIDRATSLRKRLFETNALDDCDAILQDL